MATSNLGLEEINPADYVSPTTINNNFAKVDALGVDYVVESGYSGDWWYRKWSSGRAECGIDSWQYGEKEVTKNDQTGFYWTAWQNIGAYPLTFAATPLCNVVWQGDAGNSSAYGWCVQQHSTSTTTGPKFFVAQWTANKCKPKVGVFVCGRWK